LIAFEQNWLNSNKDDVKAVYPHLKQQLQDKWTELDQVIIII